MEIQILTIRGLTLINEYLEKKKWNYVHAEAKINLHKNSCSQ